MEKRLGKIQKCYFGLGGYQDCMIGIHFDLAMGGTGWGVGDSRCTWDKNLIESSGYTQWTEADRDKGYSETVRFISDLLHKAKVSKIQDLIGKPIEVEFDGNVLKSWRILEEVL